MNHEDILNMMRGKFQNNQSVLKRNPTVEELDAFIDRCCSERDETLYSLAQALVFKLERGVHSLPEAEIYPMVISRIQERLEKGEK